MKKINQNLVNLRDFAVDGGERANEMRAEIPEVYEEDLQTVSNFIELIERTQVCVNLRLSSREVILDYSKRASDPEGIFERTLEMAQEMDKEGLL